MARSVIVALALFSFWLPACGTPDEAGSDGANDEGTDGDSTSGGTEGGEGSGEGGDGDGDGDVDGDGDGNGDGDGDCGNGEIDPGEQCDDANADQTDGCVMCKLAYCGDGYTQAGVEECDDGNEDDDDACQPTFCTESYCGDGKVWAGMEECDDGNMDDDDACIACVAATCGDGFVQAGVEDCDDANMDDTDDCVDGCVAAACGDGFIQDGVEECDDDNMADDDGCSSSCLWEYRYAFVTSTTHTGDLGGLAGADAICNARAAAENLPGTYMAWISTNQGSPSTRFTQSTVPYITPDPQYGTVANDWADLVDSSLITALARTEAGGPSINITGNTCGGSLRLARTGTTAMGTAAIQTCSNFSSGANNSFGSIGKTTSVDGAWSTCVDRACDGLMPIYCFQQ